MADVTLDFQFTSSVEKVWKALTDSDLLEKWIWKNDFKPDGIVNGEVLEVEEPHILSYTWASA